jgi:hypothetical protein
MTDPTFQSRAELEAWAGRKRHKQTLAYCAGRERTARSLGNRLRRVTLAHSHLPHDGGKVE